MKRKRKVEFAQNVRFIFNVSESEHQSFLFGIVLYLKVIKVDLSLSLAQQIDDKEHI